MDLQLFKFQRGHTTIIEEKTPEGVFYRIVVNKRGGKDSSQAHRANPFGSTTGRSGFGKMEGCMFWILYC